MLIKDTHCLEAIVEAVDRIIEYNIEFDSVDDFGKDQKSFDATMMNFVIIGEMVDRLSGNLKGLHSHIDWLRIKGFRNIVAHDYFGIDLEEVWQIIKTDIPELRAGIQGLL